nr:hypothetical protein Iba_chr11aCG11490 [Ipomoea batatas]
MLVDQSFSPETGERDRTTGGDSPSLLLADEGTATSERGLSCHAKLRKRPDRTCCLHTRENRGCRRGIDAV